MKFGRSPEIIQASIKRTKTPTPGQPSNEEVRSIMCIREMATALVLSHTGVEFDDGVMDNLCGHVASVAEEFGWSPDRVQEILEMHEPGLAAVV